MKKNKKRSDGRLQSKVYLGDGQYKYVYADNNKELTRKIDEIKLLAGKGVDVTAERDTFEDWSQRWLKIKKPEISAKRYDAYQYTLKHFDSLKNVPICKIKTIDIQDIILDAADEGAAKQTLLQYKSVCRQIIQLAIDNRVLDYNAANAVKIPKSAPKETKRALTSEEQKWITAPTDHRGQTAAMIMMYAGLRRGELIPLLWSDIDLSKRTITINKSVEMKNSRPKVKEGAKTTAGTRVISIPKVLADYLKDQPRSSFLVCPDAHGNMYTEGGWKRMWESYMRELNFRFGDFSNVMVTDKKTGELKKYVLPKSRFAPSKIPMVIPPITAHWLRHTYITMLYLAGVDILTAKEQAGHSDIKTTMQIYTHLDAEYKTNQINKLDDYLSKIG